MPIRIRCSKCKTRLTVAEPKPGGRIRCPSCQAALILPRTESGDRDDVEDDAGPNVLMRSIVVGAAFVLLLGGSIIGAVALMHGDEEVPVDIAAIAPKIDTKVPKQEKEQPKNDPSKSLASPEEKAEAIVRLDAFGNPVGRDAGLVRGQSFKGKKLLAWCGPQRIMDRFLGDDNPLWKALRDRGMEVVRKSGRFEPAWLTSVDQFWLFSNTDGKPPATLTKKLDNPNLDPEAWRNAIKAMVSDRNFYRAILLKQRKDSAKGASLPDLEISDDLLDDQIAQVVSGTEPPSIDEQGFQAIENFIKSGKGLYLLAENDPFFYEADVLTQRLYGTPVRGNYLAEKIAYVKARNLDPEQVAKYKGQFDVADHPLLTGVNFFFEGSTVSHLQPAAGLTVAFRASDGQILMAVSSVPGQRVVVDCGYTRYLYGKASHNHYVVRTAGTLRLAENVAAYLLGEVK